MANPVHEDRYRYLLASVVLIGGVGSPSHVPEDSSLTEGIEVDDTPPFNGTFNGNGYEITGLTVHLSNPVVQVTSDRAFSEERD